MNNPCRFFNIINIYYVKSVILMNDFFHKIIQKNHNYFLFFLHILLCNIFVFFIFCFVSLTVIAGKEKDASESKKKDDDENVHIAIFDSSKSCKNNITFSENGIVFYPWENDLLKLLGKNIAIPWSLVQLIKMMPLKLESLFLKKIISFYVIKLQQKNSHWFNFFYKIEHLYSFLIYNDKDIKCIMEHVYYVDIAEVFRFCGFPSVEVVENVRTWVDLEKGHTLDWLWKNLSLHFKEQEIPNKHVFFSLISEMKKAILLPCIMSESIDQFEKDWLLCKNLPENRNRDDWCMIKRKLSSFFSFLFSKNIILTRVFIKQIKHFDFERMILFCDKCKCFYENSQEKLLISSFFLRSPCAAETLLKYNNEDIKFIATHPFYKNILIIYRRREFPPARMVREINTWVNIREGVTLEWIWNNLSLSFKGSGIPEKDVFFSRVAHVERNIQLIGYYKVIECGFKKEKRDNNKKRSDGYNEKNIEKANELLILLERKKIEDVLSFINIALELSVDRVTDFLDKIIYFYSKAEETRSIASIFLCSMEKVYLFLENSREDIEFIAQHSYYLLISKVYFGVSFPIVSCVKKVDTWKHFVGGEDALWTALAKMYTNCGMPTQKKFFLRDLELSYNNHAFHKKNKKEELAVQKIKLSNYHMSALLSSSTDILNNVESENEINDYEKLNDLCSKKLKEKIGELWTFLIKKRIKNIALVIELLYKVMLELDDNTIADFCDKMMCFYSNTEEKRSLIPSFLNSMEKVNLFLTNNHEDIEFIARHPCYSEIYEVYYGVCFPNASCVKKFDTWENIIENITLVSLWKLLAKMFPCCGMPKKGTFIFHWFELSYKQYKICEKNHKNDFTLQEEKLNFDNAMLLLSLNTDMLSDVQRKNKVINNQSGSKRLEEDWDEKVINKIYELFRLLEDKNIKNIPSFMDIILKLRNDNIIIFCAKMILFYSKAKEKRSIVPIFLNSIKKVNLFLYYNTQKNIESIAQHPYYSYISEVYRGVNFPSSWHVNVVESWKNTMNTKSIFLWELLVQVFAGYGIPQREMLFFFCSCCDAFSKKKSNL